MEKINQNILCKIMIIEPKGVVNTGNAGGNLTVDNDVWI